MEGKREMDMETEAETEDAGRNGRWARGEAGFTGLTKGPNGPCEAPRLTQWAWL